MKDLTYRPEINGLRAFAVIAVIISHFNRSILPGGHLGVDIFFVISGFVITQSLLSRKQATFGEFIKDFYTRRVKRILPALILSVAVTFFIVILILNPDSNLYVSAKKTAIASLFGVSNILLLRQATDYFGAVAELNPFTHTWSLGVEEQFYLFFPILLWISGINRNGVNGHRNFSWILTLTGFFSLFYYVYLSSTNSVAAFYLMPARFWELAAGAIAYLIMSQRKKVAFEFSHPITYLSAALIIASLFIQPAYTAVATVIAVSASFIFILCIQPANYIYKVLTTKPVLYLGTISYSLYLWHWSVLTISHLTVGVQGGFILIQVAIIFLLSVLSYRYVEMPLRRADWTLLKVSGKSISVPWHGFAAIFTTALFIYVFAVPLKGVLYAGKPAKLIQKEVETLIQTQDYHGQYFWHGNQCVLSSNDDSRKVIHPENCTFGDFGTAQRHFLVIGNSFSAAEIEMFKVLVDMNLGSVTITSSWGSSAVPEVELNNPWSLANRHYWADVVPSLIERLHRGDIVIMINDGKDYSPANPSDFYKKRLTMLRNGLERFTKEMAVKGISILYQRGTPFVLESNCTPDMAVRQWWHMDNEPPCNYYKKEDSLERRKPYDLILDSIKRNHQNFYLLDIFDVLCPDKICKFYNDDGVFLYRDEYSHPGIESSTLAQPHLLESIKQVLKLAPTH